MSGTGDDQFDQGPTVVGVSFADEIAEAKDARPPAPDPFGKTAMAPSYDERLAAMGLPPEPDAAEPATQVAGLSYDERMRQMAAEASAPTAAPPGPASAPRGPEPAPQPPGSAHAPQPSPGPAPPAPGPPTAPSGPGLARTVAIHGLALPVPGAPAPAAPGYPSAPGASPGYPSPGGYAAPSYASPVASAPGVAPAPAAPHAPKSGPSPIVLALIGAGAVFLVGGLLMAIVIGVWLLRG